MQSGSKTVLQLLFDQKSFGTFCDVQLHVKDSTLWAHGCVLASCSTYFKEHLDYNDSDHWCVRTPKVINLDLCATCVCKVIDFMYLRELVVPKGHFEHFCTVANFLNVSDLLPFCKKYFEVRDSTSSSKSFASENLNKNVSDPNKVNEIVSNEAPSTDGVTKEQHSNQNENSSQYNKKEITNSFLKTHHNLELVNNSTEQCKPTTKMNNQNKQKSAENLPFSGSINRIKKCEFLCCNPDLNTNISQGFGAKYRRKRKMSCEVCQFSSISIKKILNHIHATKHLEEICPVCNLKEDNFKQLSLHVQYHYNSKPFICHICEKRNRFWENHNLHLRVHCRNKQFQCKVCQKSFKNKKNLSIHSLAHDNKHVCNECGAVFPNESNYKKHLLMHNSDQANNRLVEKEENEEISTADKQAKEHEQNKLKVLKKFQCHVCSIRFTQQKNLARHIQLKHQTAEEHKCSMCTYSNKRYDLIRDHMKRHHNCLPPKEPKSRKRKENPKFNHKEECSHKNGIVGVLIPVQIISADDNSVVNGYAVEAVSNKVPENEERVQLTNPNDKENGNIYSDSNNTICESKSLNNCGKEPLQDFISEPLVSAHANLILESEELQNSLSIQDENKNYSSKTEEIGSDSKDSNENLWLNEATGELITNSCFINVPNIDTDFTDNQNLCADLRVEKSTVLSPDFENSFQSLIFNETTGDLASLDLDDDIQSNPQTPQTNLMDCDNQNNLFPWESLVDNFCSTWVLNESTGELNMVSFGMQPLKSCDELKLDENTGTFSLLDDDETALFLNEGTGDLSVIYFNPSKNYCDTSNYFINDKLNQEKLETMSLHSNDEDDLLNEEFLLASANFMAQDENEKFLNELTGEFDVTDYKFHSDTQNVLGIYLNEETGEISGNAAEKDLNNDTLPNGDFLGFDFEDSLNCEDYEQFSTEMSDFSSQFCLANDNSNDWHNFDDTEDTLLNECTGELVKRC